MLYRLGAVIFLSFIFISVQAQISNLPDGVGSPIRSGRSKSAADVDTYYSETWNRGTVNWANGTNSVNVLMRYNVINKKLELKSEDKQFEFQPKDVKEFEYTINFFPEVELFKFSRTDLVGLKNADDFVRVIYSGKNVIVEKIETEVIQNASSYVVTESSTKVIKKSKFFIKKENSAEFTSIRLNTKSFSKLFPDKDVKSIIKNADLNLDKNSDIIKLMKNLEN